MLLNEEGAIDLYIIGLIVNLQDTRLVICFYRVAGSNKKKFYLIWQQFPQIKNINIQLEIH